MASALCLGSQQWLKNAIGRLANQKTISFQAELKLSLGVNGGEEGGDKSQVGRQHEDGERMDDEVRSGSSEGTLMSGTVRCEGTALLGAEGFLIGQTHYAWFFNSGSHHRFMETLNLPILQHFK